MSPRDVYAELRSAQVAAPPALRARVRLTAAQAPPERRVTRRRLALVLVPVAVAAAAAAVVVVSTRSTGQQEAQHGDVALRAATAPAPKAAAVAPTRGRAQRYEASLQLRVTGVSDAVQRALRITASLGGYPTSVHVTTAAYGSSAQLVLRVPRAHVQQAIARLSQLGTIVGEQVDIQDLQAGINATDRTIVRLQRRLAQLRAQPQTPDVTRQIAALTARVVALQRARATTIRTAHYATVRLALSTPLPAQSHHRHWLRDARPWLGGAAALLIVLLALRALRRLRENALLSRP